MIRTPRTNPPRCTCGKCPTCTDDLSRWAGNLQPRQGDLLAPVNLERPERRPHQPRHARPTPDVDSFDQHMAELTARIRTPEQETPQC